MGALLTFAALEAKLRQAPLANTSATERIFLAIVVVTFLLGVLGSILILAGKRAGYWMSIVHQLMLVPLLYLPNGFRWIMEDAASAALFVSKDAIGWGYTVTFSFGDATISSVLNPKPDTTYIGINVLALVFAYCIYLAKRRGTLIDGSAGEGVPVARLIIYLIAFLQILAAIISFAKIYQQYKAMPADSAIASWLFVGAGIYMVGFVGAILLFLRSPRGISLSVLFHLLCTPVLLIASQQFIYASVEIVNLVVFYLVEADKHTIGFLLDAGPDLYDEFPKFTQVPTIVAVNLFALFCAIYLSAAKSQLRSRAGMTVAG